MDIDEFAALEDINRNAAESRLKYDLRLPPERRRFEQQKRPTGKPRLKTFVRIKTPSPQPES